ncbi:carbon storage regulator [Oceanotoga teriensis]|uniref:carbon storage regulator n=1 Tax=Oceanotoga teriensis TaxID=515440 RepID=UPI00271297B3|nr:carbon storage regulator [Oceanotoga teriensis]MDO7976120.1 carbon storage regulator [Oceanotoga teriensis]
MLILSRKKGETLIIKVGKELLKIKIVEDGPGNIKIGFDAPPEFKIYRGELYEEIVKENKNSININIEKIKDISKHIYGSLESEN